MIGQLKGIVISKDMEVSCSTSSGVGCEVSCPLTVLDQLPPAGGTAVVCIHTHVRKTKLPLWFAEFRWATAFQTIDLNQRRRTKIDSLFVGTERQYLIAAIGGGDVKNLTTVPGLGKRTSERIMSNSERR